MAIHQATPEDTFDHMLGSGALTFSWWKNTQTTGYDAVTGEISDDWTCAITCETGDGGQTTETINHQTVLKACRNVVKNLPQYAGENLRRECSNMLFRADETDFDAPLADSLLQYMVLGEIVFG